MQEGETGNAMKKGHDRRTRVEACLIRAPRLQRAAGHCQNLGCLTLGDTLGLQRAIPRPQVSAFDTRPALVAIIIATLLVLENRCHSSLLCQPVACTSSWLRMARERAGFNPDSWRVAAFLGPHLYQVADAVIEARRFTSKSLSALWHCSW